MGHLSLEKSLLDDNFFTVDAKNMTCLEPAYENGLNQKGWNISYKILMILAA